MISGALIDRVSGKSQLPVQAVTHTRWFMFDLLNWQIRRYLT
ncbi:hypothetical protein [Lentimicrobium sp.]|nr:hypothetical protein [Lentimicrobium sp.]HPF63554.1 hypothetical protein [Lentimicrobium sp.]HRW68141.1 hypothetical protein [Lentimicrobium sp.]